MMSRRNEDREAPDRRRTLRINARLPVRLQRRGTVRWAETAIKDISVGGFRCTAYGVVWGVGMQVTFETPLFLKESPFIGVAKIVHMEQVLHADEYELGLIFTDISPESAGKVRRFIEEGRKNNIG